MMTRSSSWLPAESLGIAFKKVPLPCIMTSLSGTTDMDATEAPEDESLERASELGMRPLMERVLSRREILRA